MCLTLTPLGDARINALTVLRPFIGIENSVLRVGSRRNASLEK